MAAALENKLFLLDAMALIYRAHFAFIKNPRITSDGRNTSAVFGFANTLLEVLEKERPTHIGVAFESDVPTKRHETFAEYKANREEVPEDIIAAVPQVQRLLEALCIPTLKVDGYEADDVIGTLAWQAAEQGMEVYMMTPDKDYAQLVKDHVYLYRPALGPSRQETLDAEGVVAKFGVRPDQIPDFLGLKGDSVDNIPGVPKVGDKTAVQLLQEFDTLENLLDNLEQVTKKAVKASLEEHAAQGRQSKELATIHTDVEIALDEANLRRCAPDAEKLVALLDELEFRALKKRLFGNNDDDDGSGQGNLFASGEAPSIAEASSLKTLADRTVEYQTLTDDKDIDQLVGDLQAQPAWVFDTETTSLDELHAQLVGLSFAWEADKAYYIPFPEDQAEAHKLAERFQPAFAHEEARKIAHNLKYDLHILANYGIVVSEPFFDTMLAHYVTHAETRHSMDRLAETLLGYKPVPITELIGPKGKKQKTMREVPVEDAARYACEDADITWQLYEKLLPELKTQGTEKLFWEVDQPLVPVLTAMEREGIRVDAEELHRFSQELGEDLDKLEGQIYDESGEAFNIKSPKQLGEILFDKLKLGGKPKKTKTGQYVTDEETLTRLADAGHRLPELLLQYRQIQKLKSTYVDTLPELINPDTGRVHTSYNQAVTITGRLSSNNPNLQNIPIRTERGREVRKAFVPRDEAHVLLSADYSQIELRIMAALSKDEAMLEAFRAGEDIHRATASRVFGVAAEDVDDEQRRRAKMVNFGIIYGITAFGLSQRLNIPRGEAAEIIDEYFRQYREVKRFMDECIDTAKERGYAQTLMGRRHYLPDLNSRNATVRGFAERNAINTPIQGTAADLIKLAMIAIHHELNEQGYRSRMLLQVHDELVFDAHQSEVEKLRELVRTEMMAAMDLGLPLEVETGTGSTWLAAH